MVNKHFRNFTFNGKTKTNQTIFFLVHEIPHEIGDFAILLKSGFNRWDAAKAQLLTATAGLFGALVAIGGSGVTSAMGKLFDNFDYSSDNIL